MRPLLSILLPVVGFAVLLAFGGLFPRVAAVLDLALPFFGLIGLGLVCGRLVPIPEDGLRWLNFFIVYVSLPALFFNLIAATPIGELTNGRFVVATTACTFAAFLLAFGIGLATTRGALAEATMQGVAGSYSNIGYMGPGLTLAALGSASAAPTGLIFVADTVLLFSLVPFLMALAATDRLPMRATLRLVVTRIATHPFNIATAVGIFASRFHLTPPVPVTKMLVLLQNAAAPCALFVMGVTVVLRPMTRVTAEVPILLAIKLIVHPFMVWALLSAIGGFDRVWVFTAVLMASLPPALNVFVMANQFGVYVERASSLILIGTISSVVTVTALLYAMSSGMLPVSLFAR